MNNFLVHKYMNKSLFYAFYNRNEHRNLFLDGKTNLMFLQLMQNFEKLL